ncbi:MAG TPA: 1-deoxy-D-xylulose-5-phosphate synthase [Syntrophomonadaceae bacterium]|nr:1-deoxy-D-xylulose-5-phosphate synthase [Syntrophomonadaceae bacterium]
MYEILDKIELPYGVRKLKLSEKRQLAHDIRELLIASVANCGGHLASNLGVVELSIALHTVFDTGLDRVIWDVGHQSYVHKILTGRWKEMENLRQYGGLSGFPKGLESGHDAFDTGHSSTSISAALGMARARDQLGQKHAVVAVIGDGALSGGMAFEALNHAGQLDTDMLVILNDNEMSISKNVGALSAYLNRLRTDPSYTRTKEEIETVLHKIPGIGSNLARAASRFKDKVKYLMVPGIFFEELGFTYIGPVNGHDLQELTLVLTNVRRMKGPVLLHIITQKGRGYAPALQNPDLFHGVGPFDIDTGHLPKKSRKTYTELFGQYMTEKARDDQAVVAITAAMASGTGLNEFAHLYPERFYDVGICEQHAVTMAAGMAKAGLKPVVAIYSTFLQRAFDQVLHDVAMQKLPVIFAVDRAGLVGEDGPTHQGVFDLAYLGLIPNLTIMAPADENELLDMLHTAFLLESPVAIRYPRGVGEGVEIQQERQYLEPGSGRIVQEGQDIAILAIGRGVKLGQGAVNLLAEEGISALLFDARFAKPLPEKQILELAGRFPRLVCIEDNSMAGGFGSSVLEILNDQQQNNQVLRIGIPDEFIQHGRVELLFDFLEMNPPSIVQRIIHRWPKLGRNRSLELLRFGKK